MDSIFSRHAADARRARRLAHINTFVDQEQDAKEIDLAAARRLMVEAIRLVPVDLAWEHANRLRKVLGDDDPLVFQAMEITADKGSPDAAFALYELAGDMTAQLRWLVRADALGHGQACVIADGLRAEGLLAPRT